MQDKLNRGALVALVASLLAMPVMAEPMSDDAAMQLLQRVNDLEREISGLRGENEKLRNDLDNVQKDQKTALEQVDERMEKLKSQPDTSTATNSSSSPSTSDSSSQSSSTSTSSSSDKLDSSNTSSSSDKLDSSKTDSSSLSSTSSDKDKTDSSDSVKKDDPSGFYTYGTGKTDDKNPATDKKPEEKSDTTKLDTVKTDDSKPSSDSTDKATDKTDTASSESKTDSKTSTNGKLPEREERSAYDEAFQTLLKEPKTSIPLFRTFLKDYPTSSLAPSAQYWIGEALYADKDFKGAIEEFLTVLKDHKGSDKAPDAALKLGYSFYELGEWEKARKTLEDVISFFPDNAETAQKAKDRLEKMKGEGH